MGGRRGPAPRTAGHGPHLCVLHLPVSKSTTTHHFRTLREAGLVRQVNRGNSRAATLRKDDLDKRFSGTAGPDPPQRPSSVPSRRSPLARRRAAPPAGVRPFATYRTVYLRIRLRSTYCMMPPFR
ncbi:helix-turn-helix domain-containing protein [Streptomyces sp. NBC_01637]|nr:helix-turn-helix domain-containing protein [Streptomyces sp. NBC_01653]WTD91824.1 helix-turn-helix domain-containing protein [Streptomyces sp. NBC_01637]